MLILKFSEEILYNLYFKYFVTKQKNYTNCHIHTTLLIVQAEVIHM